MKRTSRPRAATVRKPTLSPTRIQTYLECAVKYRYVYLDKIGRYYSRARAGYSFGSTLHNVLRAFHEQGETQTAAEMATEVERRWVGAGYESAEQEQEHREVGRQIAEAYHEAHRQRAALEVETIATEKTITCDLGRFRLTGRVDRIDRRADGRVEVVDYKSGRLETSPEEVRDSLAMCCYQLILGKMYRGSPVFATIYCLRNGSAASYELAGEQMARFEQDIVVLGGEILDRDFAGLAPEPVPACEFCDFHPRCERFWKERDRHGEWDAPQSPHSEHGL